jgi:8-hydroxy-5-deazaflavin:NADPH oxidoreductase
MWKRSRHVSATGRLAPHALQRIQLPSRRYFAESLGHRDPIEPNLPPAPGLDEPQARVEREVLGHEHMRIEQVCGESAANRLSFGEGDQRPTMPLPLHRWLDRDIVEQERAYLLLEHDEPEELAAPDLTIGYAPGIVVPHRTGRLAGAVDVVSVSTAHERLHHLGITRHCWANPEETTTPRGSSAADEAGHVAAEIDANAARSNAEAVTDAEIVILAVPFDAVQSIASELGSGLDGKILIDVTNRFRPEQLDGSSNAELIQGMAPTALVVKAFNTVFASHQVDPVIDGIQLDGYVAGDDAIAKQRVLELVDSLGFRPIDTGSLAMARALEGMALLNISLNMVNGWPWQTGWKLLGPSG